MLLAWFAVSQYRCMILISVCFLVFDSNRCMTDWLRSEPAERELTLGTKLILAMVHGLLVSMIVIICDHNRPAEAISK